MLRLACSYTVEAGVKVCAPVHDALLIEAPEEKLDWAIAETQRCMELASSYVLDGCHLKSDAQIVRYSDRFLESDEDRRIWNLVSEILSKK